MGTWIEFSCPACGNTAEVSGGPDVGLRITTQTMTCRDCRELVDVVTHSFAMGDDAQIGRCPTCGGEKLDAWGRTPEPRGSLFDPNENHDAPCDDCPKCGSPMSAGEVTANWD